MKFSPFDPAAITHFVREGYAVYHGLVNPPVIADARKFVMARITPIRPPDMHEAAVRIMDELQKTDTYRQITENAGIVNTLQDYLGPDLCILGHDALWINAPKDKNPVLLKGVHQDAWTGTSVNTIFVKTFFTDVDDHNGIAVYPGSHLQGMIPVRNRGVDPRAKVNFKGINLNAIKAGDVLIWHPLLLHSTVGHSGKNIRISMTSRYKSTETPFSSQERALGYRPLSVGPMNQILRLIGNDNLTPLRTYGGFVGVDKRMRALYPHSPYREE